MMFVRVDDTDSMLSRRTYEGRVNTYILQCASNCRVCSSSRMYDLPSKTFTICHNDSSVAMAIPEMTRH
jgi:hypothetical protein